MLSEDWTSAMVKFKSYYETDLPDWLQLVSLAKSSSSGQSADARKLATLEKTLAELRSEVREQRSRTLNFRMKGKGEAVADCLHTAFGDARQKDERWLWKRK